MEKENKSLQNSVENDYVKVHGSEKKPLPGAEKSSPVSPDEELIVTLIVRRPPVSGFLEKKSTSPFAAGQPLSREEFAKSHSADQQDIKKVRNFAEAHELSVKEVHEASGRILLAGTVSAFSKAFNVELANYEHTDFRYRGRTGPIHIPKELADSVEAVLGLDNRPQGRPHFQIYEEKKEARGANASSTSYTPPQLAELYNFPQNVDCSGQCIGIIELGGGYNPDEMNQYFSSLGVKQPVLTDVSVNGAANQPTGDPSGADGEVALDIEVAGAVAPGVRIAVYFAPNTDAGFLNAITTAVHDTTNKPSVISISWGSAESGWTTQAMNAMDRAFQDAASMGVTVCCAAGDQGSADGVNDGLVHVDFPASSPHVLGCGGTKLTGNGQTIANEVVWNEGPGSSTGGGVSTVFPLPSWQSSAQVPRSANPGGTVGRGVPDVAGDADPATGYQILVDGKQAVYGGTSAVAPLWAGLIALINQELGRPVGFLNPALYQLPAASGALHDITAGNNVSGSERGAYKAKKGWDPCTGLGSPNGASLLNALKG